MWGLRGPQLEQGVDRRMFPTHVGIARIASMLPMRKGYVPYACGDCASVQKARWTGRQCSLRMWGLRVFGIVAELTDEMFPTHVGIARRIRRRIPNARYVPYACGDCALS